VEFSYPPRERDVLTLLRKNSAGPINGIFAGWPEGATRKLGDVTVRASYCSVNSIGHTWSSKKKAGPVSYLA
jgi:hypothetical protein